MKHILTSDSQRYAKMSAAELRAGFLLDSLFSHENIHLYWCDLDRAIVGGAAPTGRPLQLLTPEAMRSDFFLQRRELGVLNIGCAGSITVDGNHYDLSNGDALYIGLGCKSVTFSSAAAKDPAKYYLLSYPAHAKFPTSFIRRDAVTPMDLGSPAGSNQRRLYKYIHPDGVKSCQLVMGVTRLDPGSVWNTMPPHTHLRRSEIYLYFDLPSDARVIHLMGRPDETRHLMVADGEVVLSPPWSIHAGAGTSAYSFCWGMGGENQVFTDMDGVAIAELR